MAVFETQVDLSLQEPAVPVPTRDTSRRIVTFIEEYPSITITWTLSWDDDFAELNDKERLVTET